MYVVESYPLAVILCFVTMLCWGSWANTQKLASKSWGFQLFYWDYTLGVVLLSLIFGLTIGSNGEAGQAFMPNLSEATIKAIILALLGGIIFNLANLLLVAAIEIAGMAIAFPIGIGIALSQGVVLNYMASPVGNPFYIFSGVGLVMLAIVIDAIAYKRISSGTTTKKGILISLAAGILMGFFFRFVAASMSEDFSNPVKGFLTPYSAMFIFSVGIFLSNFLFNTFFMYKPINSNKVTYADYFKKGTPKLHMIGLLGGIIWSIGMILSLIASGKAGFAISYGLGQGATMIAAIWGVFVWKEFKMAPKGTNVLIAFMFGFFILGLGLIIFSRIA